MKLYLYDNTRVSMLEVKGFCAYRAPVLPLQPPPLNFHERMDRYRRTTPQSPRKQGP